MQDPFDRRVHNAEGQKKIFDNRFKYLLLLLTVLTAISGLWDKCGFLAHNSQSGINNHQTDSLSALEKSSAKKDPPPLAAKRHHPRTTVPSPQENSNPKAGTSPNEKTNEKKVENPTLSSLPRPTAPLQIVNSDNIEFKLLSAEGYTRAQTIKMTVVLTTSSANRYIWSGVRSIIDLDGNEYKLKSFTNGASDYDHHIALNTGVPIKCSFTFGGILPNVRYIRLFKFEYMHKSLDDPISVEFRDIPIDWK